MKKTKILLGALSLTALAPTIPMMLTSCGENKSFTPTINKDGNIEKAVASTTELNRAFSITCTCKDGYQVDPSKTTVKVGDKILTLDVDYIVYYDVIIVASSAVNNKNVTVNVMSTITATSFTVSLYANEGSFNGKSSMIFTEVNKGTQLKDIPGYEEPTKADGETFAYWLDANGNKLTKESTVTSNIMLGAYFEEKAGDPQNIQTDNWATVAAACESASKFATSYLQANANMGESEAISFIKDKIAKFAKKETGYINLAKEVQLNLGGRYSKVRVRLIDVGKDVAFDGSTKTLFTWEFQDIIDVCNYNYIGSSTWYLEDATTGEVLHSCLLREDCNKVLKETLPLSIQKKIVPVKKQTKTDSPYSVVESKEEIFPLSYGEIGLQYANQVVNDLSGEGQYKFYNAQVGTACSTAVTKFYLGFDGTKPYGEGNYPIIQYQMWMRSPNTESLIWRYNPDNQSLRTCYSNEGLGVAPAFCL